VKKQKVKKLLYLVHRIPYPPNKGDKIRSFHWLKGLSAQYEIYLGTFIDDENDWQYVNQLDGYCKAVHIEKLAPSRAKIKSLTGLLSGEPLTIPYYASKKMQQWVSETIKKESITDVLVFSSSMAQFVDHQQFNNCHRVIDFVDMDSDKWMQYAEKKQWPMSWVYQREAKTLFEYEKAVARKFNNSLFVSNKESDFFSTKLNDDAVQVDYVNNGVDTAYFAHDKNLANPFGKNDKVIVFTGAMDYWANVDAVKWFASEVFPAVSKQLPTARFVIVGSKPAQEVLSLQTLDGITVTGFVDDVRPYIQYANVAIAPMRIARGIQNKVLEAMSMGKVVIASAQGLEGINAEVGKDLMLATARQQWIDQVVTLINQADELMEKNARECVLKHYSWHSNIVKLSRCFNQSLF